MIWINSIRTPLSIFHPLIHTINIIWSKQSTMSTSLVARNKKANEGYIFNHYLNLRTTMWILTQPGGISYYERIMERRTTIEEGNNHQKIVYRLSREVEYITYILWLVIQIPWVWDKLLKHRKLFLALYLFSCAIIYCTELLTPINP